MADFSLVTHVLQARHLPVLEDWLAFFGRRPAAIVAYLGHDPEAAAAVERFCAGRGLALTAIAGRPEDDIKAGETALLTEQFRRVETPFAFVCRLDTIPFRQGDDGWLDAVLSTLAEEELLFFTASTRLYRADVDHALPHHVLTGRVSNNCLLIRPENWLEIQARYPEETARYHRFATEGVLEHHCRATGARGLRRLNTPDWRIVHTQAWDARMDAVRRDFHAGRRIGPFLRGYEDDLKHPWQKIYGLPKPPLARRLRIRAGEIRRRLTGA